MSVIEAEPMPRKKPLNGAAESPAPTEPAPGTVQPERKPQPGGIPDLTQEQLRQLAEAVEVPECGPACPYKKLCRCKGECMDEEDEPDEEDDDYEPVLESVRGRHRWRREKKTKRPCLKMYRTNCSCCQGRCDCQERFHAGEGTDCCRACDCCRGNCDCPAKMLCEHYSQIPAGLTRKQLAALLEQAKPGDYADRCPPPKPSRDSLLHPARVALMEKRQSLQQGLWHAQDAHRKPSDRLGIIAEAVGLNTVQHEEKAVEDRQESPREKEERERRETLQEALDHGRAVAARLQAKEKPCPPTA